jgi:hypothetical protein
MTTMRLLEMLHMDLFGPVAYISIDGNKYGLVIIDDYDNHETIGNATHGLVWTCCIHKH